MGEIIGLSSSYINIFGIVLEILGIFSIFYNKKAVRKEGGFEGSEYVDVKTGKPLEKIIVVDEKTAIIGTILIICGLSLQIISAL